MFFVVFGPLILAVNCLFDIFWFLRHVYLSEEEIDKAPLKEKGLMTNSVDRRTFKKMLDYFVKWDEEPGKDQRQLALHKHVCEDIRDYLGVHEAIRQMIFPIESKELFKARDASGKLESSRAGDDVTNTTQ